MADLLVFPPPCRCSGQLLLVALWAVLLHMWTFTFEATLLLPGRSLLHFLQYLLQQQRLRTASAIAFWLISSAEGWMGSFVCSTGMAHGVCSNPLTARYSSIACTAALIVSGATASKWR